MHVSTMTTLQRVRTTRWRKITRIEQDSNLYLPITDRLSYQLNYLILSPVMKIIWLRTRQIFWSDVHQDNGDVDRLCRTPIAVRWLYVCSSIRIIFQNRKTELLSTRMLHHVRTVEFPIHSIDHSSLKQIYGTQQGLLLSWWVLSP